MFRDIIEGLSVLDAVEAEHLQREVRGYFRHGLTLQDGDVVVDCGANIGRILHYQSYESITIDVLFVRRCLLTCLSLHGPKSDSYRH
jgi:hypothetical protein